MDLVTYHDEAGTPLVDLAGAELIEPGDTGASAIPADVGRDVAGPLPPRRDPARGIPASWSSTPRTRSRSAPCWSMASVAATWAWRAEGVEVSRVGEAQRQATTRGRRRGGPLGPLLPLVTTTDQQVGHQPRPARLMGRAEPLSGVAVEVLVEQQRSVPCRVGLELVVVTEHRPSTVLVRQEQSRRGAGTSSSAMSSERQLLAGAGRIFDVKSSPKNRAKRRMPR